ncbi:MAG: HprK-related kinase B [Marinobacter sp.]|uniref:HprK-related kinase B n=1 Tax=Marinobacter sp. TaxID=50741 RepID=UPI00356A29A9
MIDPLNSDQIESARSDCSFELRLGFDSFDFRLLSDNPQILDTLNDYYSGLASGPAGARPANLTVYLLSRPIDTSNTCWTPVERAKVSHLGLKEACMDVPDGRWIHKVRTGMVMLQSLKAPAVFGNLQANSSQVINFINNQFLNHHQRLDYLLGHASAFTFNGATTAIAASSGGGKSTLMLKALESDGTCFLSNDRILFRPVEDQVHVLGVAKHPRVNPGTLLHSERLCPILPESERHRFATMPPAELWNVEQKYDVRIDQMYGPDKVELSGQLCNLVLLDWSLNVPEPTQLSRVDIKAKPEALDGLRKSPGPFFQAVDGSFPGEKTASAAIYAEHLTGVQVWRLSGRVDFDRAIECFSEKGLL